MNGFAKAPAVIVIAAGAILGFVTFGALTGSEEEQAGGPGPLSMQAPASSTHAAHGVHPAPRSAAEREAVVPAARYAKYPRIATVYSAAAEIPEILDGIHCYCDCDQHAGHYSLLTCFADDHGAMCDICLNEAETAFRLSRDGVDLEVIRDVIDRTYGG